MSDAEPLFTGENRSGTSTGKERLLLLVQGQRNRDLLADLLDGYEVIAPALDAGESLPEFDLCIVDEASYRSIADTLENRKENAGKRHLPVLLLVREREERETAQRLRGVADDTLRIPASRAVVRSRVESLLRTRRQSQQLALYRRAMDDATTGITITDAGNDQPLTYVNDAFVEITGYDREEVLGRNCRFLQGEETREEPVQQLREAIDAGEAASVELQNYRKGGTKFWKLLEISPVYDDTGELTHYIGFQSDITARKQAEEQLREETEKLERLLETSPIGITVLDADGAIVRANAAAEEVLGLERSDVVGRTFDEPSWKVVGKGGEPIDSDELPFSRVMATGETVRDYEHGITVDGETRWLSINAAPLSDDSGEQIGVIAAIEDITERREREHELKEAKELLRSVFDASPIGILAVNEDGITQLWSKGCERIFGWSEEEALGEPLPNVQEDKRAEFDSLRNNVIEREQSVEGYETVRQRKDGSLVPVALTTAPMRNSDGEVTGVVVLVEEITEKKERQDELNRYERIVETTSDLIYTLDEDLAFTSFNTALAQFVGLPEDAITGEHLSIAFEDEHVEALEEVTNDVLEDEMTETSVQTTLVDQRGEERHFQTTVSLNLSGQEADELVCVGSDITELQERERRLSVFDRVLRHNVRNKMNIIHGWTDLINTDTTEEVAADAAEKIQEASEELLDLAEKVRKFDSILDPGESDLVTTMDVAKEVEKVASEIKVSYPTASISVETPPVAEAKVHEAFELALNELIDNAVKHSEERPSVHLSVTIDDVSDAVVVRVADDGPGIPDLEQQSVSAGQESSLQHTNGLGLWFVRWMVMNSGGTMRIEDNEPTGAVVELRLLEQ